jgi:hypothetical protein
MAVAALKRKPALKTFHATLLVTRTEELRWSRLFEQICRLDKWELLPG